MPEQEGSPTSLNWLKRETQSALINFKTGVKQGDYPLFTDSSDRELYFQSRLAIAQNPSTAEEDRRRATNEIYEAILPAIPTLLNRYAPPGVEEPDLLFDTYIGTIAAIKNYKPKYGDPNSGESIQFGAFLTSHIIWHIRSPEFVEYVDLPYHVTKTFRAEIREILRAERMFSEEGTTRYELYQQYAAHTKSPISPLRFDAILDNIIHMQRISLDQLDEDQEPEDPDADTEGAVIFSEAKNNFQTRAFSGLKPRSQQVINQHFGLNGQPLTLREIAEQLNPSSTFQNVSSLRAAALRKMRRIITIQGSEGKLLELLSEIKNGLLSDE